MQVLVLALSLPKMLIEVRDYLISSGNFFEMN
jgi:hypothetical protein